MESGVFVGGDGEIRTLGCQFTRGLYTPENPLFSAFLKIESRGCPPQKVQKVHTKVHTKIRPIEKPHRPKADGEFPYQEDFSMTESLLFLFFNEIVSGTVTDDAVVCCPCPIFVPVNHFALNH